MNGDNRRTMTGEIAATFIVLSWRQTDIGDFPAAGQGYPGKLAFGLKRRKIGCFTWTFSEGNGGAGRRVRSSLSRRDS